MKSVTDIFEMYCALKAHFFTDSYDYFRYAGKISKKRNTFRDRHDKTFFEKFSKMHVDHEAFIISNFLAGKEWLGDMLLEESGETTYRDYIRRRDSFSYVFENDLNIIYSRDSFSVPKDGYPYIIELWLQKRVSLESLAILDHFIEFHHWFDTQYGKTDVLWNKMRRDMLKIYPFIKYDRDRVKVILEKALYGKEQKAG